MLGKYISSSTSHWIGKELNRFSPLPLFSYETASWWGNIFLIGFTWAQTVLQQKIGSQEPQHNLLLNDELLHYFFPPPHCMLFSPLGESMKPFTQNQGNVAGMKKGREASYYFINRNIWIYSRALSWSQTAPHVRCAIIELFIFRQTQTKNGLGPDAN